MHRETRQAVDAYSQQIARLNGVDSAAHTFAVTPSVQQTLETKIQESSDFLKRINIIGVREQEGEKIGLGVTGPIAGRTDTTAADRQTRDVHGLDSRKYRCEQTNYDTHVRYATLDAWAKFPDFQTRLRDAILRQQALDRIMIGWHGTSVAANTNRTTNPLLQDVNKGWLHHLRTDTPARVMKEVAAGSNKVQIGAAVTAANGYKNLDAAVFDATQLLDPWYQNDGGLVAILGRALMHDKYFPLVNINQAPTETLATDIVISQKRVGGLPAVTVPNFPANAVLVTRLDNLSIYFQTGARRRLFTDNPKRDRYENYESSNDAYVIEDHGCAALVENIEML